jgi:hypothetical protein
VGGCGGGSQPAVAQVPAQVSIAASFGITLNNLQIAEALYRDSTRTPPGFLTDPPPAGQPFVATRHLRNTDVGMLAASSYELCTDDWNQALQWSEDSAQRSGGAPLVGNLTDSRYFEFDRMITGQPAIYQRTRVFRCAYLDRSGASTNVSSGPAGTLARRPLLAIDLRELSEYLWQFSGYNNYGSAVLSSTGDSTSNDLRHTLVIATLVSNVAGSGCDRIDVQAWRHVAGGNSGELSRVAEPLWNFTAGQSAGAAVSCGP